MTNGCRGDSEVNLSRWRDMGTLDAYYEANMDLRDARPQLNLSNAYWPLRTAYYDEPRRNSSLTRTGGADWRYIQ